MSMPLHYTLISLRPYEPKFSFIVFNLIPDSAFVNPIFFMFVESHSKIFHSGNGEYLNG